MKKMWVLYAGLGLIGMVWVALGQSWSITNVSPNNLPPNHAAVMWQDFETPFTTSNTPAGGFPSSGWTKKIMSNNTDWVWATNGINGNPPSAWLSYRDGSSKTKPEYRQPWVNPTLGTSNRFARFGAASYGNVTRLFSPPIDISKFNGNTPTMSFWHVQVEWPADQDYLMVYATGDATNIAHLLSKPYNQGGLPRVVGTNVMGWTCLGVYWDIVNAWTQRVFSLANMTLGTNIAVMFEGIGEYAYGVGIDDLILFGNTSAPPANTWVQITNLWQDFETPWTPGTTNEARPGVATNMVPRGGYPSTGWTKVIFSNNVNWVQATNGIHGNPPSAWLSYTGGDKKTGAVYRAPWLNQVTGTSNKFARFGAASYGIVTRLYTPPLDLTGLANPTLTFWHVQVEWPADQDYLKVRIHPNFNQFAATSSTFVGYGTGNLDGNGWQTLAFYSAPQSTWTQRTLAITNTLGTNMVIAFEGIGEYAYGTCIDDVMVTAWSNTAAPPRYRTMTNLWQDFEVTWTASNTPSGGYPASGWSKAIMSNNTDWVQTTNGINGNPPSAWLSYTGGGTKTGAVYRVPWVNPVTGTSNKIARLGAASYGNVTRLFTPPLDLSQSHSVTMSFWHAQVEWPADQDYLRVRVHTNFSWFVATNRGNAEALGWRTLAFYSGMQNAWTSRVFTIAPTNRSANTVFMFEGIGEYAYGTCLDDLQIVSQVPDDTPAGTEGRIALSPPSLAFTAPYGGPNPAGQALTVSNGGINAFTWTGEASANWLSGSPSGGTVQPGAAGQSTLSVDVAGLNVGAHSTFFTVLSPGASNSPQLVSVTVTVTKASQTISFPAIAPQNASATTLVSATASSGLPVGFAVVSGPGSLVGSNTLTYSAAGTVRVAASQAGDANWLAAPGVTNAIRVWQVSPNRGPVGGGGAVVINCSALGNGSDITSVTVGGANAPITGQTADSVSVTIPAGAGTVAIVVTSTSQGATTLSNAYTYNAQGVISGGSGGTTGVRKWQSVGQSNVPGFTNAVGANNTLYTLYYYNGILYAGGAFTNIGGSNCFRIARWNGTNWTDMAGGVVKAANVNNIFANWYGVFAGGYFTNIGGTNAWAIARWDGTNWNAMGSAPLPDMDVPYKRGLFFSRNVNGYVNFVCGYTGTTVIVGGYFTNSDYRGAAIKYIAQNHGTAFTNMQGGFGNVPLAAAYDQSRKYMYVGGSFTNGGGMPLGVNNIAQWNGTHWTNLAQGLGNRPTCLAVHPTSGELYIGGWFTNYKDSAGNKWPANYIAKWNPVSRTFTNLGSGFNNWVYAIAFGTNGEVYAAGSFTNTWLAPQKDPGAPHRGVSRIAMWDGTYWTNIGGFSDTILTLATDTRNGDLYAGGFFRTAYNEDGSSTNAWYVAKMGLASGGVTPAIEPSSGSVTGGYQVIIHGSNLTDPSDPADLADVTLCGVSAASIVSATPTQIVVVAGVFFSGSRTGDVRVVSTAHGTAVATNAFVYTGVLASVLQVKGINAEVIASGESVSESKGTRFPKLRPNAGWTNRFSLNNPGGAPVTISGYGKSGAGAGAFTVSMYSGSLAPGTMTNFMVVFNPVAPGEYPAALLITNSASGVYTVNLAGGCWTISTNVGPTAGGNQVTVTNGYFGSITNVLVGPTFLSAIPVASGSNWFTLVLPAASTAGVANLTVQTSDNGATTLSNAYTYNPAGVIASVTPPSGSVTGGYPVVIAGANLGSGTDVTNVTLCGVAASVQSQSATQTVVTAGATTPATGHVRVYSVSFGESVASNAFTYQKNTQTITFPAIGNQAATSTVGMAATASSGLPVALVVGSGPAEITGGTNLSFTGAGAVSIVASQTGNNTYAAAPDVTNAFTVSQVAQAISFGTIAPQNAANATGLGATASSGLAVTFEVVSGPGSLADGTNLTYSGVGTVLVRASQAGNAYYTAAATLTNTIKVWSIAPDNGPFAGGNSVVITNGMLGNGMDISGVTIGGETALVTAQGGNWVRVTAPAASSAGVKDIVVTSVSLGGTTLAGAYTCNPTGSIASVTPASGSVTGGYQVAIAGSNLGNGSDVTNVTLAGVAATIQGQSATQVVVTAGASASALTGHVVVVSTSHGASTANDAFEYMKESQTITFPAITEQFVTNRVGLAATASSGLTVSFTVGSGPASITGGTNMTFTSAGEVSIVAAQAGNSLYNAASDVTNTFSVVKAQQVITFPAIVPQAVTNRTPLDATADTTLPVTYEVKEGPGVVVEE